MRTAIVNLVTKELSGGYCKYLNTLVPLLQSDPRISALDVFLPRKCLERVSIDPLVLRAFDPPRGVGGRPLKNLVLATRPDVVFIPSARLVNFGAVPSVVMVRNMEPLATPFSGNRPSECCVNLARRFTAQLACRRATRIIAVSDYVKSFLVDRWGIDLRKIAVVYHGVEHPAENRQSMRPKVLNGYCEGPMFFTAGSIRPARGLQDLIRSLAIVNRGAACRLVIAGAATADSVAYQASIERLASNLGVSARIIWAGQLKPAEMSWCYSRCAAVVMTSRVEACPNVALEGMAHECLCISTDNPPMPEFFRRTALYYRAGDVETLASHMYRALEAGEEVRCLRQLSLARSQDFMWEHTSRLTVQTMADAARCV
jgi:glycosyltransferase involved in cell wall biosynthesis